MFKKWWRFLAFAKSICPVEQGVNSEISQTNPMPLLQVENLSLAYGNRVILENVSFEVHAGEFWFLLGGNGMGKTSFLNCLLGLIPAQHGAYHLHPVLRSRARIGFVPQQCSFNPSLATSVREFVSLGLVGIETHKTEREAALHFALQQLNLTAFAQRNYWSLSGGQQQRVRVARALVRRPYFLLMDEPTNGLDLAVQSALLEDLARLQQEGLTILLVSHDLQLATQYATHVALFNAGKVQAGTAADLLTAPILKQLYGTQQLPHCPHCLTAHV